MSSSLKKDFQQRPTWIFITLFLVVIGSASNFSSIVLDWFPELSSFKNWIELCFIIGIMSVFVFVYFIDKKQHHNFDKERRSKEELLQESINRSKWQFKILQIRYLLLIIITLKIIPLLICRLISWWFIDSKYKSYGFNVFTLPEYWKTKKKL